MDIVNLKTPAIAANARSEDGHSPSRQTPGPAAWLCLAIAVHRERRALRRLTDQQLLDIGLTRAQALRESRRAWRDLPQERVSLASRDGRMM